MKDDAISSVTATDAEAEEKSSNLLDEAKGTLNSLNQ